MSEGRAARVNGAEPFAALAQRFRVLRFDARGYGRSAVGYEDAALAYFLDACAVDLLDAHGNTADGIHVASCGGTWLALVAGFGGLRAFDGQMRFHPRLPAEWDRLRFRIQVREQLIEVDMTHDATTYRLLDGRGILIQHFGEELRLTSGAAIERPVRQSFPRAA
jgi:alpha,alpha-trehalose phosphorylase